MIQSHAKKDKRPKRLCLRLFVFFYMASIPHEQKESAAGAVLRMGNYCSTVIIAGISCFLRETTPFKIKLSPEGSTPMASRMSSCALLPT